MVSRTPKNVTDGAYKATSETDKNQKKSSTTT